LSRILQHRTATPVKPLLSWKSLSAAAAILIVLISGLYYQLHTTKNISPKETIQTAADNKEYDVEPGRDQAVLILADGSKIILDGRENGTVSTQGNIQVVKLDNRLVYDKQAGNGRPVYNTIATPKAGQYQITLSDGTKVWLNSSSSLHFPTAFTGSERV